MTVGVWQRFGLWVGATLLLTVVILSRRTW